MFHNFPDLTPLVWFGIFGVIVTALVGSAALLWAGYHLIVALVSYIGG